MAKKPKPKAAHGNKSGTKRPAVAKGSVKPAAKRAPVKKPVPAPKPKAAAPAAVHKPAPKPVLKPAGKPVKPLPKSVLKPVKAPTKQPEAPPRPEFPPSPPTPTPSPRPVFVAPARPPEPQRPTPIKLKPPTGPNAPRILAVRALLEAQRNHNLPGLLEQFGPEPTLEFAGGPRHMGKERVGQIYGDMLRAFPDLTIDVIGEHAGERSVVVEFVMQGTHRQQWLGMAPRGRTLTLPVCAVFLFDKKDQLSAQRLYLDRNLAIVQLTSGLLR